MRTSCRRRRSRDRTSRASLPAWLSLTVGTAFPGSVPPTVKSDWTVNVFGPFYGYGLFPLTETDSDPWDGDPSQNGNSSHQGKSSYRDPNPNPYWWKNFYIVQCSYQRNPLYRESSPCPSPLVEISYYAGVFSNICWLVKNHLHEINLSTVLRLKSYEMMRCPIMTSNHIATSQPVMLTSRHYFPSYFFVS